MQSFLRFVWLSLFCVCISSAYSQDIALGTILNFRSDSSDMDSAAIEIPEARIMPYATYDDFRDAFINMNPVNDNSESNMNIIQYQKNKNRTYDADSYINLKYTMLAKDHNNNSIPFLTTEPDKGIIGALNIIGIWLPWQKRPKSINQ